MNWKPLIFWGLGFTFAALAGLVASESVWNTPLLVIASILVLVGMLFEFKPAPKSPGYRLYQANKYLSIKDSCKEIIYIHRGNTNVAVQIEPDGKLFACTNNNSISTDGKTENTLDTVAGKLTVTRQKNGYRLSWVKGVWAYQ